MKTKITKREKLLHVSNCWNAADYWLVHGRIYNDEKTAFQRVKFVLVLDLTCDLWDEEAQSERNYMEVLDEMILSFCDCLPSKYSASAVSEFIEACNDTIRRYNKTAA